jgi:hypothetical protein
VYIHTVHSCHHHSIHQQQASSAPLPPRQPFAFAVLHRCSAYCMSWALGWVKGPWGCWLLAAGCSVAPMSVTHLTVPPYGTTTTSEHRFSGARCPEQGPRLTATLPLPYRTSTTGEARKRRKKGIIASCFGAPATGYASRCWGTRGHKHKIYPCGYGRAPSAHHLQPQHITRGAVLYVSGRAHRPLCYFHPPYPYTTMIYEKYFLCCTVQYSTVHSHSLVQPQTPPSISIQRRPSPCLPLFLSSCSKTGPWRSDHAKPTPNHNEISLPLSDPPAFFSPSPPKSTSQRRCAGNAAVQLQLQHKQASTLRR